MKAVLRAAYTMMSVGKLPQEILLILVWGLRPKPSLRWELCLVVGVAQLRTDVGVPYIGGVDFLVWGSIPQCGLWGRGQDF